MLPGISRDRDPCSRRAPDRPSAPRRALGQPAESSAMEPTDPGSAASADLGRRLRSALTGTAELHTAGTDTDGVRSRLCSYSPATWTGLRPSSWGPADRDCG